MALSAADRRFVVDKRLGAVPMERLLDVRVQLRFEGRIDKLLPPAEDRPVLEGTQALQPEVPYAAEHADSLRFFLPRYRVLADAEGRPAVELRLAAPGGEDTGSLALTLTWDAPAVEAGLTLRVLEHRIALSLRCRVPVQGGDGAAGDTGFEHRFALQPPVPVGERQLRSTSPIADRALFDALYQALRTPAQAAALELQCIASVGVRTWRQVLVGRFTANDQLKLALRNRALFTDMLQAPAPTPAPATPVSPIASTPITTLPPPVMVDPALLHLTELRTLPGRSALMVKPLRAATIAPMRAMPVMPVKAVPQVEAATLMAAPAVSGLQVATAATAARIDPAMLNSLVLNSDFKIDSRAVVPARIALDDARQPAIVDSDLECRQELPFCFDPQQPANAGAYLAPGYDAAIHLLLPVTLTKDGKLYRVYQDNLMREVAHVAPTAFTLQREDTAPYLPALSFLASDFSTSGEGAETQVVHRVSMVYRLEPWLDETVVELARAAWAEQGLVPRFTCTIPPDAVLTLDLDLLGDDQVRRAARADLNGVDDVIDLDQDRFVRLWRERLAPPGSEIRGRVEFKHFDGTPQQVDVRLSLTEGSAQLLDVVFQGPVEGQPGRLGVLVRNRIESPVQISALPGEPLTGGGMAHPADPAAVVGTVLPPLGTLRIEYDLGGGSAPADFSPSVMASPQPNLAALLRLLMVVPGSASLGFDLALQAAESCFAATGGIGGTEPLTGLLVEFDDGTRTTLTPQSPQAAVSLFGRLIDQLLGQAGPAQRYFYRVTNLHASGEGARTGWAEGVAGGALTVGRAQVGLDF